MNFGLAPYFKYMLHKEIKASDCFGVSFDGSMKKVLQEEQMDVQIKYSNETTKLVDVQFFDSQFLRHPYAKNLFDSLITLLKDLPSQYLLQLSVDCPNTNWSASALLHGNTSFS